MHVGAIAIFEGPPPGYDEFIEGLESRLHLVPRYRQKLAFPPLEAGEALLENAYTPPEYRGFGIMSAAMAPIAERGSEREARAVLTYVRADNVASLKGCQRAGFASYSKLENRWYAFGLVKEIYHAFLPDSFRLPHERLAA